MLITFGKTINLNKPAMKEEKPSQREELSILTPLMADTVCFGKKNNRIVKDQQVALIKGFMSQIYSNWQNATPISELKDKKPYYNQYGLEISGQKYLFKNSYKPNNEYFIIENMTTGEKITQLSSDSLNLKTIQYSSKEDQFSLMGNPKSDDVIRSLKSMIEIIYVISTQTNQGIDPVRINAFINFIEPNPFKE